MTTARRLPATELLQVHFLQMPYIAKRFIVSGGCPTRINRCVKSVRMELDWRRDDICLNPHFPDKGRRGLWSLVLFPARPAEQRK